MDKTPAIETVNLGLLPGRVKPKTLKLAFIAFPGDNVKLQYVLSKWEIDLKE